MRLPEKSSLWLAFAVVASGCGRTGPALPVGTGAREAAHAFFAAVADGNAAAAYAILDPQSRAGMTNEQFARRVERYLRQVGFQPRKIQVWACEEHDAVAVAHVALTGSDGRRVHRFKDATQLRRTADGWSVVLSPQFGGVSSR